MSPNTKKVEKRVYNLRNLKNQFIFASEGTVQVPK